MIEKQAFSLFELLRTVKSQLKSAFATPMWVVAEIMEGNINRNRHCYLELVEKEPNTERIIAKSRATIWANVAERLLPYFETVTGETLRPGIKVMVRVAIEMHEAYGFSLNIVDIDAQYTLGDIAQQRAKVIAQLTADGVIDMNKQHALPLVVQRIAVVSSDSAAGWGDFKDQIEKNSYAIDFQVELFPAIMQGDSASESIIAAMDKIFERIDDFDVVAIMRGGGSKSDLSCFDKYDLAFYVAQYPIPVITGIGHERDDSVLDIVACVRLKTPTAIASFLIERAINFRLELEEKCERFFAHARHLVDSNIQRIGNNQHRVVLAARNFLMSKQEELLRVEMLKQNVIKNLFDEKQRELDRFEQNVKFLPQLKLVGEINRVKQCEQRFRKALNYFIANQEHRIAQLEQTNNQLNPQNILRRGYSIVTCDGVPIKSASQVKSGDEFVVKTSEGEFGGIVK